MEFEEFRDYCRARGACLPSPLYNAELTATGKRVSQSFDCYRSLLRFILRSAAQNWRCSLL